MSPTQRNGYQYLLYCLVPEDFGPEVAGRWVLYLAGGTQKGWAVDRIGPSFATHEEARVYVADYFPSESFPHLNVNPDNRAMHSADVSWKLG